MLKQKDRPERCLMNTTLGLDHCFSFINCHVKPSDKPLMAPAPSSPKLAITISRQSGCGAHFLAEKIADYLQKHTPKDAPPWTVFDRNLVERVLAEHHLPERIASYMPEDRISEINDIMDELFGLHPSSWTLVRKTSETILHLAELGNVIIVGRGSTVVTAKLPHMVHVRLIGSLEQRIQKMQEFERLDKAGAARRVHDEDLGRVRYMRKHFERDIDDPLLYHLVINTDLVSLEDAARVIGDYALNRRVLVPA